MGEDTNKITDSDSVDIFTIPDLRNNMILADDVVNKQGVVVLAKNTKLTSSNFEKLSQYGVNSVKVWKSSIDENEDYLVPDELAAITETVLSSDDKAAEMLEFTIAHLRKNMVLAEDAENSLGITVLKVGTVLSETEFQKLLKDNVVHVSILAESVDNSQPLFINSTDEDNNGNLNKPYSDDEVIMLTIADLRKNMILAEDAVNKQGVVVLARNTKLTSINFDKLSKYNVINLTVWKSSVDENEKPFINNSSKSQIPLNAVTAKKEFRRFTEVYSKKIDEFKSCLSAIERGEQISEEPLYEIVEGIVGVVQNKTELFQYSYYLSGLDDYNYIHSVNVSVLCHVFANWLELSDENVRRVSIAGLLHDIGKSRIDPDIVEREPDISEREMIEFKRHPEYSYDMIKDQDIDDEIKRAVFCHHERIDGSGYPSGLKGDRISPFAKIVAICDAYDKEITKNKLCPFDVINSFEHKNLGVLDTEYLIKFCRNILYIYIGSTVRLSNNKKAEVMFISKKAPDKPIVSIDGNFISLEEHDELYIRSMI